MKFLYRKKIIITFIFLLISGSYFVFVDLRIKITCSKYGDKIFDNLFGFDSDCYERKIRGVIYPNEKITGNRYNSLKNKKKINCPSNSPIIIISGQSNSANFIKSFKKYDNSHFNYFNGNCYELSSPTLGAEGEMSSLAPAIAKKIISKKKFIFITSGIGGISIEGAAKVNGDFINYNKHALKNLKIKNNYLKYFIWIHGEANNKKTDNYQNKFRYIFDTIVRERKSKVKLIITQTSICNNQRDIQLNEIQKKISQVYNSKNIIDTDELKNNYRYDGCHFNQFGLSKISTNISNLINQIENE